MNRATQHLILTAAACCLLSGCAPRPIPSRFFMPAPRAAERSFAGTQAPSVGVGPIEIAEYLDQAQIVTKVGDYEYALHEFSRWAAPLRNTVPAILRENLASRLRTERIFDYPWTQSAARPAYQIAVDIVRLHCDTAERCELMAFWEISDLERSGIVAIKESTLSTVAAGADYTDQVAAISRLLGELSDEIAEAMPAGR